MVEWSIEALRATASVRSILLACPPGHGGNFGDGVVVVDGGATRSQSVSNALAAVETDLVAIHDAARPLLTPKLLEGIVSLLAADPEAAGAIAATPVTDTVKRQTKAASTTLEGANAAFVIAETLDRAGLWAAQTPQVFRTAALRAALEVDAAARDAATDEAMLVEAAGMRVLIHPSSPRNLKVTTPHDLRLAELLLA
jgi:2-C-methyl-D-erythritol 4-phosphate cytidylyltransferase